MQAEVQERCAGGTVALAGRIRRRSERGRSGGIEMPRARIEALDAELAQHARGAGRLRLEIGRGLDAMARSGGHHEMGYSSVEAYALERCERSSSWTQKARALAMRMGALPGTQRALISGSITWSMAAVLGTVARPEDEETWLAIARERTVRQMRAYVGAVGRDAVEPACSEPEPLRESELEPPRESGPLRESELEPLRESGPLRESEPEPLRTLSVTVPREEAWLFEAARMLARHLGETNQADAMLAMVAETMTTLYASMPASAVPLDEDDSSERMQRAWEEQLRDMRDRAERLCESRIQEQRIREGVRESDSLRASRPHQARANSPENVELLAWPPGAEDIDVLLRRLAAELAEREVAYGEALESFWRADGWRRLGYATARQYASERLGASLSSIKDRRQLARRLQSLPELRVTLERRELGYEAARLVAGVATAVTARDWVARAKERTLRHLREEIDAAELVGRWNDGGPAVPPSERTMREIAELERGVVAGRISASDLAELERRVTAGDQGEGYGAETSAILQTGGCSRSATVTFRLPVPRSTAREYRRLERLFRRYGPARGSFLRFMCDTFLDVWRPPPGEAAYAHIYERDLFRCQSPVCGRRDVTPHHLRFRSAGGDDSDDNVASLCTWCHLDGIHGGKLEAEPPASAIRWTLGRSGHTVVTGRRRWHSSQG